MSQNIPLRIQNKLDLIPSRTGIYKFFDEKKTLLYIGKAVNLRSRVGSYFRDTHYDRPHIISMIPIIYEIEYIETDGEVEALVLESALIKENLPPYNQALKDDKSYAYIYITTKEDIPLVKVVRPNKKEKFTKGRLFGPYPSGRGIRQVFRYIRKLYPFCTCKNPKEPCLYYHMGQCPGPSFGYISKKEYMDNIGEIIKFLNGKKKRHVSQIEKEMVDLASNHEYEKAAVLRDQIEDLQHLGNRINFSYKDNEDDYLQRRQNLLKKELITIGEDLKLETPVRIECYDISNIQGQFAYGSMVVNVGGSSNTKEYRIFKIKEKDTPDDYAMLAETLNRRLKHIDNDPKDKSLNTKPDIVLIDGGKGQLSAVRDLLPSDIFLVGISKGRHFKKKGRRKLDQFWVLDGDNSIQVKVRNPRILINLRDEAHRFALKHHRKARNFAKKKSVLDGIRGVGPKRKKDLIKKFGSVSGIKKADISEILEVVNNEKLAEKIKIELK